VKGSSKGCFRVNAIPLVNEKIANNIPDEELVDA